jgi:pilin/secretion family protein with methylation motif
MDAENKSRGFSLFEVMVSLLVLMVASGAAFRALVYYQKNYSSTRMRAVMHEGVRGAVELISQEVGQAGLLDFTTQTTIAPIPALPYAQTATLFSVDSIFQGEILVVGTSTEEESVTVQNVDRTVSPPTISAIFNKAHPAGTKVRAYGVFPQGILIPDGSANGSDANNLKIFGDINRDGNITYVQYICDTTAGTLSRSATAWTGDPAELANPPEILVDNLIDTPGVPCFQYSPPISAGPYTFVTSVAITLSARTSKVDPQTRQYVTMKKSFLNLAPRNVLMGLELALSGSTTRLQPKPPHVPLPFS